MSNNGMLILPDKRICLICNTRPKEGTDDLCDACTRRLFRHYMAGDRATSGERGRQDDRHRRLFVPAEDFDSSPGQQNAIRIMEEIST